MSERLSNLQRLSLYHMGKRHLADEKDRVPVAVLKSQVHENYKPAPSNGNFRVSLKRLVARGYLIEHANGSLGKAKTPSYQLTESGLEVAMKIVTEMESKGRSAIHFLL